jgi:hypothetical protein
VTAGVVVLWNNSTDRKRQTVAALHSVTGAPTKHAANPKPAGICHPVRPMNATVCGDGIIPCQISPPAQQIKVRLRGDGDPPGDGRTIAIGCATSETCQQIPQVPIRRGRIVNWGAPAVYVALMGMITACG